MNPDYANVAYTDMEGRVVCSAVGPPGDKPVNVGKTPWFQKFRSGKRFSVGDPFLGPITGKWVSVLSVPIWNARHEMIGGIHFPFDLRALDPNISTQFLPQGSRYGFQTDADSVLVWRNVDPEGIVGTRRISEAARRTSEVRDGQFESVGSDGGTRFFSVLPMPEPGWIAFVGVPASAVYAGAKQRAMVATSFNAMVERVDATTSQLEATKAELDRAQAASQVGSWVWDIASDTMRLSEETCRILR